MENKDEVLFDFAGSEETYEQVDTKREAVRQMYENSKYKSRDIEEYIKTGKWPLYTATEIATTTEYQFEPQDTDVKGKSR